MRPVRREVRLLAAGRIDHVAAEQNGFAGQRAYLWLFLAPTATLWREGSAVCQDRSRVNRSSSKAIASRRYLALGIDSSTSGRRPANALM
jgi:hypothetical protein